MSTRNKLMKMLMKPFKRPKASHREAAAKTKWNILRGDLVQVISRTHPENGKQGIVLEVNRRTDRVLVGGVNMGVKRIKGDRERGLLGRTIQRERTIHYSNVNLVDPVTGFPTRVVRKFLDDGTKVRVSKRSGAIIPRPEILKLRKRPISQTVTESCTADDDAWEITYVPRTPDT